jgi:hypothetical protein
MDKFYDREVFPVSAELCEEEEFCSYPFASATLQNNVLLENDYFDVIESLFDDDYDFGYPPVALPVSMTDGSIFVVPEDNNFVPCVYPFQISPAEEEIEAKVLNDSLPSDLYLPSSLYLPTVANQNLVQVECDDKITAAEETKQYRARAIVRWLDKQRKRKK